MIIPTVTDMSVTGTTDIRSMSLFRQLVSNRLRTVSHLLENPWEITQHKRAVGRERASVICKGRLPTPALLAGRGFVARYSHVTLAVTIARLTEYHSL